MSDRWGATPEAWRHWSAHLQLTEDLLPVVCNPHAPLHASSTVSALGKLPSRYVSGGSVCGIPAWTSLHATPGQVDDWSREPDYGICLQTRRVRALDVDVTDPDEAAAIWATLRTCCPTFLARRQRRDSSKFLLLFRLDGAWGKRTLETAHGVIEFLANGQQCVIGGTHQGGARYTWEPALPASLPTLTAEAFEALWSDLCLCFLTPGGSVTAARVRRPRGEANRAGFDAHSEANDPVLCFLQARGLLLDRSQDGRVYLACPFASAHTSGGDPTATCYFPAGTGSYEQGHFTCLHAHCSGKTDADFLSAIGYATDGFEVLAEAVPSRLGDAWDPEARAALSALGVDLASDLMGADPTGVAPEPLPPFERDLQTSWIRCVERNVILAVRRPDLCGVRVLYDAFTDALLAERGGVRRPFRDEDYTAIALALRGSLGSPAKGFGPGDIPKEVLRAAVAFVGRESAVDSAQAWLTGLPGWDGVPRVARFCEAYLGCPPSDYARAVSRYWWTAQAGRVLDPGCQADMAVVLIAGQGTGKTSTLRALVPEARQYVELNLMDRDEDLSRRMRGVLVGEMAELRGINSREMESIKAWISRREESWVPKYKEFATTFPRRCVLVGTSNQEEFLADETGNRRWLPIVVGARQDVDAIGRDRDQLWAEGRVLFESGALIDGAGVLWRDAEALARAEHEQFRLVDPWESAVRQWLCDGGLRADRPDEREYVTAEDILHEALRVENRQIKMAEYFRIGKILHAIGYRRVAKRIEGVVKKVWIKKNAEL
jgi:hypothetical protein